MLPAVIDDVLRQGRSETADVHKQVLRGRVDIDADEVDAALHRPVERVLEFGLVHVVLILSHADALRVDLDQFGQRVHQSSADGDRSTRRHVLVGKLLARRRRGRVDGGAVLGDREDAHLRQGGIVVEHLIDKIPRLAARRAVAYGDGLDGEVLHHACGRHSGLGTVALGRVRVEDLVVEQVALGVEAGDLASVGKSGVDGHHALLSQRGGEEQLAQVLGEDMDGLFVGLFLAQRRKLILNTRVYEPSEGVLHGFAHEALTGAVASDKLSAQAVLHGFFVGDGDTDAQHARLLAAAHGQQSVGGAAAQRLGEVEVVGKLLCLVRLGHFLDDLRADHGLAAVGRTHGVARLLVFAHSLGDDVLGASQRCLHVGHVALDEALCRLSGVGLALQQEDRGQRFQSLLPRHLRPGAPPRLEGQVDVLQLRGVPAVADAPLQFGRELFLLGDGLEDRRLALLQLLELRVEFADACDLHLVEVARPLLAVACDEGDGAALVEQF